ncbi:MAG: GPGG-motif small membrane protein [Ilumatobacteraceae bacterium]
MNASLLWIIAVLFVIAGLLAVLQGNMLLGILLIVIGALVGPGGVSIFSRRG